MVSYIALGAVLALLLFLFSRFRPAATGRISGDLYAVNALFVNFYMLKTPAGIALFDTGLSPGGTVRGLRKLNVEPEAVKFIFLTHSDFDHTGGLAAFQNAKVYLPKAEVPMTDGTTARRGFIHNRSITGCQPLADGAVTPVGGIKIQMRHTPGHTPGSSSYWIDGRILVTGDLLRLTYKGRMKPFTRLMNMNHQQDTASVDAIRAEADRAAYVLTGHTGFLRRGA